MSSPSVQRLAGATVAASLLVAPAAHAAKKPPHPDSSAVAQYVEMLPTGSGDKAAGVGKRTVTPLTASQSSRLHHDAGRTASSLESIATSSDYGAPSQSLPLPEKGTRAKAIEELLTPSSNRSAVAPSTIGAVAEYGAPNGTGMLLTLLVMSTAGLLLLAYRRRA
jgi:hypothetical protein